MKKALWLILLVALSTGCATNPKKITGTTETSTLVNSPVPMPPPLPVCEPPKVSLWTKIKMKFFCKKPKTTPAKSVEKEIKVGKLYIDTTYHQGMRVYWIAEPLKNYTLYSTTNSPIQNMWQKVLTMTGEGQTFSYVDEPDSQYKFYKLKTESK